MSEETQKEKPQDGLALVIGGLFILALIFAAYNYFKSGREPGVTDTADSTQIEQNTDEEQGDLNGDGAKDVKTDTTTNGSSTGSSLDTTGASGALNTAWTANDYTQGDINGASYTVKSGDTLWEIAEGLYGDGSQWVKILDANNANVGFLASGQQALIVPGQVLVLP